MIASVALALSLASPASPAAGADERHEGVATFEDPLDFLRAALTPAVTTLFDDLERDLRSGAAPLPPEVRRRLRPFFTAQTAGTFRLTPAALERAVYVVDAERARDVFALAPPGVEAITLGDVLAFSGDGYRPDCIEGLALIGHELVHVAQYAALGKAEFLDRYFLGETLREVLTGDGAEEALDASRNALEVAAYCHQERICRALVSAGELKPCNGRATARCATCPRAAPRASPAVHAGAPVGSARKPVPTR